MNRILSCSTETKVEFHGCASDEIAGILFTLNDIIDGRVLLTDVRGRTPGPKTAAEHVGHHLESIQKAKDILVALMDAAASAGASRG